MSAQCSLLDIYYLAVIQTEKVTSTLPTTNCYLSTPVKLVVSHIETYAMVKRNGQSFLKKLIFSVNVHPTLCL